MYNINGETLSTVYTLYGEEIDAYIEGRTVVFEDNFASLNTENWGFEIGNVRNNELQFYRAQNATIEEGNLVLTARREAHQNKAWTSASITGQKKKGFLYGRFEAKIKMPGVVGSFPAFWTLGYNHEIAYSADNDSTTATQADGSVAWPACGEIDIVEGIPGNATSAQCNLWAYGGGSLGTRRSGTVNLAEWHVYAMEWTPKYIAMLVDGVEYKRYAFADFTDEQIQAYKLPQHMIINLAVGASGGTPPDDVNEMKMYVDWVRVYAPLT